MWIAELRESSRRWTQMALVGYPTSVPVWVSFLPPQVLPKTTQQHPPRRIKKVCCVSLSLSSGWAGSRSEQSIDGDERICNGPFMPSFPEARGFKTILLCDFFLFVFLPPVLLLFFFFFSSLRHNNGNSSLSDLFRLSFCSIVFSFFSPFRFVCPCSKPGFLFFFFFLKKKIYQSIGVSFSSFPPRNFFRSGAGSK